uniref:G0/G1 switch 2 n=1 Tax=Salarias fasciatus TaxID=181472 RepID=A0A672F9U7_SALFA
MESLHELIPLARGMLSQKPSRALLKVYMVGSVFAMMGTVIGLLETVCQPFSSGEPLDAEMLLMLARERHSLEAKALCGLTEEEEKEEEETVCEDNTSNQTMTFAKKQTPFQRPVSNRLHAS